MTPFAHPIQFLWQIALPLTALLLGFCLPGQVVAAEQCRLVRPNKLSASSDPHADGSQSTNSANPTAVSGSGPISSADTNSTDSLAPFNYGKDVIRGVNLGGWFVLEPWITPSFFENTANDAIVDEFTLGQLMDSKTALAMLKQHWKTWIVEDDFRQIAAAGLNHVRIPVGYWSVPLTPEDTNFTTSVSPYIPGAWPCLLQALNWAKQYGIHVIIDLHGAPGSQNGYDNSGQRTNNPVWGTNPANISRTLDVIEFIVKNVGGMIDVIELLNEGAGFLGPNWASAIRQFFSDGYTLVRNTAGDNIHVMIGDAFLTVNSWQNFLTYPSAQGVMMDYHEYQIFSNPELQRSFTDHINFACTYVSSLSSYASSNIWTVLGEWSNAPTDCAKWLNGRGVGARWDGTISPGAPVLGSCQGFTGDLSTFNSSYKAFLRQYWEVQVEVGESIQGWIFWTWKAENADEWSYQKGLEGGWIPQDPTDRQYPNMCSKNN